MKRLNELPPLVPAATLSELFPPGTVFAPRSTLQLTRWVHNDAFRLDTASGLPLPVMGDMPVICHCNTLTPEIHAFYHAAGIELSGPLIAYTTAAEAIQRAQECLVRGQRLAYYYPPPPEISADNDLVVPVGLYNWLNDKANLEELCDGSHLPRYQLFAPDALTAATDYLPLQAVYLKACFPGASGAGEDVRYCPDMSSRRAALSWIGSRLQGLSAVRLEEAADIRSSWCLNLVMGASGVRYLGAATQLFSSPGQQSGSRIDPLDQPTDEIVGIAMAIGERARKLGFVGVAGFDIGSTYDGKPYVFDLNFRQAACTTQILLHESATQRIGSRLTQSWGQMISGPLSPVLQRLEKFARTGHFVPLRLYEASAATEGKSLVNGIVVASSQDELNKLEGDINAVLCDMLPK